VEDTHPGAGAAPQSCSRLSLSRAREAGLASRRQPEGGDPGVREEPSLDSTREGLGGAIRSLPDFPAVNQRWNRPADGGVSPPVVVVLREVREECAQVIQPSDDWNAPQPFLLQRQHRAFCDRDGAMLAHRAKALLDVPVSQQRREHIAREDAFLVTDDVLGRSMA